MVTLARELEEASVRNERREEAKNILFEFFVAELGELGECRVAIEWKTQDDLYELSGQLAERLCDLLSPSVFYSAARSLEYGLARERRE